MTESEALKTLTDLRQEMARNHDTLVQEVRELRERVKKLEDTRGVPRRIGGLR